MTWRDSLRPASFRGVQFHRDSGNAAGGRRLAPHEFPKRDTPYVEDMGRAARRWVITAYLIGPNFNFEADDLVDALEAEGPGLLIHPTMGEMRVVSGPYSRVETREKGGMATFELQFLEAGTSGLTRPVEDTSSVVTDRSADANAAAVASTDFSIKAGPR